MKLTALYLLTTLLLVFALVAASDSLFHESSPLTKRDIARIHHVKGALQEARINGISKNVKDLCGIENYTPYIKFLGTSTVKGSTCCNEFSGVYKIEPNTNIIKFEDLLMTSVGCIAAPQDDFDILKVIQNFNRIEFKDSIIILSSNSRINMFQYQAQRS
jgi:heat shock protein HslJ